PGEQPGQAASRERDVDATGPDFHAAKQCRERRFDFVRCVGSEFLRDLTATPTAPHVSAESTGGHPPVLARPLRGARYRRIVFQDESYHIHGDWAYAAF